MGNIIESIFNSFFETETNIENDEDEEERKEGKTKGEVKQKVALDDSNSNRNRNMNSAVSKVGISIGEKTLDQVLIRYRESLNRTDCYIHGDCYLFNMLVKPAPTMESIIQSFQDDTDVEYNDSNDNSGNNKNDTDGNIALIDWEMSTVGPIGKDIGSFYAFPLACVFAHVINGDYTGSGQSILKFLDILWKEYTTSILLPPGKKGVDSVDDIYHQLLGYCGVSTIAYSFLGFHMEYLPIDGNRTNNLRRIKESLGIIGLKFMNIGFAGSHDGISGRDSDGHGDSAGEEKLTLTALQKKFNEIIKEEINRLIPDEVPRPNKRQKSLRRCSLLRQSGRRVSDAHTWLGMAASSLVINNDNDNGNSGNSNGSSGRGGLTNNIAVATTAVASSLSSSSVVSKRASILQFEKLLIDIE